MIEEWRPIPSFPSYEASSFGRIRRSSPYISTYVGKVLIPQRRKSGYVTVGLSENGNVKRVYVHRIVCSAFHGEPDCERQQAVHLDGVRDNNIPSNLVWATAKENEFHKRQHGTSPAGKTKVWRRTISDAVVAEIRLRHRYGQMQSEIADLVGVSKTYVHKIVRNHVRAAQ